MKVEYEFEVGIDLGKAIPQVGELIDSVNSELSTLGDFPKIKCESRLVTGCFTAIAPLSQTDEEIVKNLIQEQFTKSTFGKYDVRLVSFRRKSVTSELSVG
jgi:hypothetical protein